MNTTVQQVIGWGERHVYHLVSNEERGKADCGATYDVINRQGLPPSDYKPCVRCFAKVSS